MVTAIRVTLMALLAWGFTGGAYEMPRLWAKLGLLNGGYWQMLAAMGMLLAFTAVVALAGYAILRVGRK